MIDVCYKCEKRKVDYEVKIAPCLVTRKRKQIRDRKESSILFFCADCRKTLTLYLPVPHKIISERKRKKSLTK